MDKLTRVFTRLDAFLTDFTPLTPYGRARKADNPFYANTAELEREFDRTELFLRYIKASGPNAEKLAWHLKRVPRLEFPFPLRFDCAELFEIKKFLYNAKAAFGLLDEPLRSELAATLDCAELWALLARDGEPEAFYLTAEPGSELERVRGLIAAADRDMAAVKTARRAEIKERCGLDFSERAFIVLDAARAAALPEAEAHVEPHDARTAIARPAYGRRYTELAARREELDAAEKAASARRRLYRLPPPRARPKPI